MAPATSGGADGRRRLRRASGAMRSRTRDPVQIARRGHGRRTGIGRGARLPFRCGAPAVKMRERRRTARMEDSRMPMSYPFTALPEGEIPRAVVPLLQHCIDTYASETNKVA